MTVEALASVDSLSKVYRDQRTGRRVTAVDRVSFEISRGETLGLVGESGSGKTTVGRCLLKFTEPTQGRIVFEGTDVTAMPEQRFRSVRDRIQMVFQEPYHSLNPRMNVQDTIAEPLHLHKVVPGREVRLRVLELLHEVRLEEQHLRRYPHQLSSGQQQRVAIAQAIATKPSFLVLDEATSALDSSVRADVIDLLVALQRQHGMTYLYISHDLSTVRYLCDRVAVMYLGRLVEVGTVDQIFDNPLHLYTCALLSAALAPNPRVKPRRYVLLQDPPLITPEFQGCPLHGRCPEGRGPCGDPQDLLDIGQGHMVSCWRVQRGQLRALANG